MKIESTMKLLGREVASELNECCPEDKADFFNALGRGLKISIDEAPKLIESLDRPGRRLFFDLFELIKNNPKT